MVKQTSIPVIIRKRKNRAGKKKRANRLASHLRWIKRQAFEAQSKVEPTNEISLIPAASASTSQSETLTSPPQKIFNPESEFDTKFTNNFAVDSLKRKVPQESYQNTTNPEGHINELYLSEDFISQLNSLLPDELLNM